MNPTPTRQQDVAAAILITDPEFKAWVQAWRGRWPLSKLQAEAAKRFNVSLAVVRLAMRFV